MRTVLLLAALIPAAVSATSAPHADDALPPGGLADHHVHILGPGLLRDWKAAGVTFSRPDEAYSSARRYFEEGRVTRAALVPMAHLYGRAGFRDELGLTVEQEHARVRDENDHVAREAARWPGAVAFCSVGFLRPYAVDEVRRCRTELRSAGVKVHLGAADTDLREEHLAQLARIAAWAEQEGMALLVHFDPQRRGLSVEDVERFVRAVLEPHPRLEVWIAHLGGSGGYGPWTQLVLRTIGDWLRAQPVGARPGVFFDVSAVVLEEESEGVPPTSAEEAAALGRDLRWLGLERVVFGSDAPVFDPAAYAALFARRTGLSVEEARQVLGNRAPTLARVHARLADAATRDAVAEVKRRIVQAHMTRDAGALDELYAEDYTVVDADADVRTKAELLGALPTDPEIVAGSYELLAVRRFGDLVVATGRGKLERRNEDGSTRLVEYTSFNVFERRDGRWVYVAAFFP